MGDGLPGTNIIQIGIQAFTNSRVYAQVARDAGIGVVTADEVYAKGIDAVVKGALENLASKTKAIYVDFDVDVLDRAFAPRARVLGRAGSNRGCCEGQHTFAGDTGVCG